MSSITILTGTPGKGWHALAESLCRTTPRPLVEGFLACHQERETKTTPAIIQEPLAWSARSVAEAPSSLLQKLEDLIPQISQRSEPVVLWSPLAAPLLPLWLQRLPDARVIVFCESPGRTTAESLLSGLGNAPREPQALLSAWDTASKEILAVRQAHGTRVVFLDYEECSARSELFAAWLRGQSLGEPSTPPDENKNTLRATVAVIANSLAESRPQTAMLWQELQASCQPMDPSWPSFVRNHSLQSAIEAAVNTESALLRLREKAAERELHLDALQVANKALRQDLDALSRKHAETSETLLHELQTAFGESETFFERLLKNEGAMGKTTLTADKISYGYVCEDEPHKHLDVHFEALRLLSDSWPALRLRIVQHFGRAGVALFQPADCGDRRPLHPWLPTGEEDGIPLVLLMPRDRPCAAFLGKLPGKDIFLLRELVLAAIGHISAHGLPPEAKTDWAAVGREFLAELDDLPKHLHYDCLDAVPEQNKDGKSIYFNIYNVYYRGRLIPNLGFRWTTNSQLLEFAYSKDTTDRCFLVKWPAWDASRGKPLDLSLVLSGTADGATRECWLDLPLADRDLLGLIIRELPNFCHHYAEQNPTQHRSLPALLQQARAMSLAIQNLDQRPGWLPKILRRPSARR
jgi:hypothetical protein